MNTNNARYIPINKGHFELDTPERAAEFYRKLSSGWEEEYREYRRLWTDLPKRREVRKYPLLVDIELSSVCNLKCPMCYTITDAFRARVKKGLMDYDLFTRIIDEVAGNVYAVRLSLRGEATPHPRILEAVRYAKKKGIREVSFLTNGSTLELPFFKDLVAAGADWITISIDGTGEVYDGIRKPLRFDDTCRKLQDIKRFKDENGLLRPVIKAQGIWPSIRPDPTQYYATLAPITDLLAYNPLIDYLRNDSDIVYEEGFACPQLYQRLVIGSDGNVMLCSNDEDSEEIIGNAYDERIYDIWHGSMLNRVRDMHNKKSGFLELKVCRQCYYPRKAVPDETALVGDRTICVENYINRKQNIGQ